MSGFATRQDLDALVAQFNKFAGQVRTSHKQITDEHRQSMQRASQQLANLASIAEAIKMKGTVGPGFVWEQKAIRVEDIPGRRVPYDVVVDIPIVNGSVSDVEGTYLVTQEGPFVAVKRWATFQSMLQYRVTLGDTTIGTFNGRTFGRYRPVHSAWDLFDGALPLTNTLNPPPNGATPGVMATTSSASSGRSMVFDGRILMFNAGSSYPRMNYAVPSSIWTTQINSPFDLGALDFFERGEVITFKVTPNHANNPPFGNADGTSIFATGGAASSGYPFLAGQFDPQEGIVTPQGFSVSGGTVTRAATDGVTRLPDGILTVGLSGYRIIQPVGPVS